MNIPVSSDGQSISASRVNVLVGASGAGTPNTDIQFVVGYDDGSLESVVTAKAVWNSTDRSDAGGTWNILNTNIAYASPYINTLDSVHAYGDQGNLTAFSFDVNPEKKVKNIRIIQNYAAVLFAITLQTPVYEYPDGVLAYEPENVHLNYNFRDISDSHENAVDFTSGPSYQTLYVPEYDENGNTITPNDLAEYNTNPDKAPYLKDNTYTFKGIPYTLGSTEEGANNVLLPNAGKQTIPIRSGEMKAIHIVMTLVNNVAIEHGWIEVNYADGSVSQHNYLCLDQENRYNTPGNNPNIALRGLIAGRYDNAQTNFYEISLTPDAGKEVVSVTLPESMSALYVSMTAVRVIKENEISQNNTKQIHVDLSKDFDYKSFSVKENHKTLEGFGYDHTTFAGDVDILKSLQVDFNGISYKLSENARSADMTKKDSVHVTGQYLTLRGEARTNANSVNLLMSVWDTNKKDLKFTVIYTDGDQETVTVPYMRPVTMWGDPNTAAYLNGAYTYTYDSNTGKMVEGESPLQTLAMLAVSIPTNPEKQLDCIKLPEVTSVVGSLNYRTTQAVVFAVTVVAPINRYDEAAEGEKQLRGYLPVPLDLSGLANSNNLSSTHDGETDVFAFANDEWCTICQEHFYTVKYENGKAVKDQPITGDSFTYNGIPYYFVPEGNYANGRANARDISCYAGAVTIPMGSNTGSMRSINLLTAVNGGYPIHDWIEIQYTDGTSDYRRFYTPDWVHSAEDGPFHDGISYYDTINNPNVAIISDIGGGDNTGYKGRGMSIYSISLFPDTEKEVSAIVLPQRAEPIYLAVTVERAVYGDPYTDQDPKNNKPAKWTDPGYKYTTVDLPYNVNAFATADRMEAGNFDGNGLRSFSADGLTRDFSFKGVPYRLGNLEYGYYNAVRPWFQEERFYVAPGHYQSLNMLYSAFLDDKINFNIELIFSDGSTQMCDFGYTEDWSSGSKYGMAESIAINNGYYMPKEYTLCSEYTKVNGDAKIYGGTVYLTPENTKKTLTEIRIPKEGNEYSLVFAMTLYGNRTGKAPETIDNRPDGVISNGVQDRIDSYVGVKVITDGNGNGSGQMPVEDGNSILWIILAVLAVVLCALLGAIFVLLHKKNKTDKIKE